MLTLKAVLDRLARSSAGNVLLDRLAEERRILGNVLEGPARCVNVRNGEVQQASDAYFSAMRSREVSS